MPVSIAPQRRQRQFFIKALSAAGPPPLWHIPFSTFSFQFRKSKPSVRGGQGVEASRRINVTA
jgi:hypothetical protein